MALARADRSWLSRLISRSNFQRTSPTHYNLNQLTSRLSSVSETHEFPDQIEHARGDRKGRLVMKVIIVGAVAGGASCAARLRRLDEKVEILMVERGPYVSYANCGLPYYVGGVIQKESSLLVASEQLFRSQFAIEVRTNCEAISISAKEKTVDLRNVVNGQVRPSLRQARTVARCALGSSAPARYRSARHLSGSNRARCEDDPRMG